jgi:hypothetical protein
LLLLPAFMALAHANKAFESPEAAMNAFGKAVVENDEAALKAMLGNDFRKLIPPEGALLRSRFLEAWAVSHAIERKDDKEAIVKVGDDGWTLPIPLITTKAGWEFDTEAGAFEMRTRRIGRNERAAMQTMLAILDAQYEYAERDRDGDGILQYASKLVSSPGKRDGLYWPTKAGDEPSPLGPLFVAAGARNLAKDGVLGYQYKLLTAQGPNAPGGALDYKVRGKLFGGVALLAWPVRYGDTGVQTFMVNHLGQIYERDFGRDTVKRAAAVKTFDPGKGWKKVEP